MKQRIVSRSERRVEKKQTLTFLAMVLAVSLVSFVLGVMVGRMSAPPEVTQASTVPSERVVLPVEPPAQPVSAAPSELNPQQELTFFDTLPKGEQPPLGSGINLPPQPKIPAEGASVEKKSSSPAQVEREAPTQAPVAKAPAAKEQAPPASVSGESYTLQVGSFQDASDARRLQDRLASRGYSSYTERADLGSKGVWTRVFVGPYESDRAATMTASRLLAEEKISALIRRK